MDFHRVARRPFLLDLLAAGKLRPVIAARLSLDDVVRAHQLVEHAEVQGKLVLIPNPGKPTAI